MIGNAVVCLGRCCDTKMRNCCTASICDGALIRASCLRCCPKQKSERARVSACQTCQRSVPKRRACMHFWGGAVTMHVCMPFHISIVGFVGSAPHRQTSQRARAKVGNMFGLRSRFSGRVRHGVRSPIQIFRVRSEHIFVSGLVAMCGSEKGSVRAIMLRQHRPQKTKTKMHRWTSLDLPFTPWECVSGLSLTLSLSLCAFPCETHVSQ